MNIGIQTHVTQDLIKKYQKIQKPAKRGRKITNRNVKIENSVIEIKEFNKAVKRKMKEKVIADTERKAKRKKLEDEKLKEKEQEKLEEQEKLAKKAAIQLQQKKPPIIKLEKYKQTVLNFGKSMTNTIVSKPVVIENIENEGQKTTTTLNAKTVERKSLKTIQINNDILTECHEEEAIIVKKIKNKKQVEPKIKETFRKPPSLKKSKYLMK
jgi:hypothetical protein